MVPETLINTLSTERIAALVRDTLLHREDFLPEEEEALEETLRDFLARNARPFSVLIHDCAFIELHPALAARFIRRAHQLAPNAAQQDWIADRAKDLGFGNCLPKSRKRQASPMTASQERAFGRLRALATLHFRSPEVGGVSLRTMPLLCGPSGIGKTDLVTRLGRHLGLDVLRVTVSEWLIAGSRAEAQTLRAILRQIRTGKKWVLHLDEICKIRGTPDPWSQSQLTEIFNVLDRRAGSADWSVAEREGLRKNVFIVGTATFQEIWDQRSTRSVGFVVSNPGAFDFEQQVRKANLIPPELLRRFGRWLILDPLTADDFRKLADELKLTPSMLDPEAAAASGAGFRAIENALTDHALQNVMRELEDAPDTPAELVECGESSAKD